MIEIFSHSILLFIEGKIFLSFTSGNSVQTILGEIIIKVLNFDVFSFFFLINCDVKICYTLVSCFVLNNYLILINNVGKLQYVYKRVCRKNQIDKQIVFLLSKKKRGHIMSN